MICGLNVEKMIQEKLISSHVCYHFVHEADVLPRTCKDGLHTGIWPEQWDPKEMLGNMNDGHSIFKGNSMTVLTPLETTGTSAGLPIEVPQCIRMIAFIDLKVLVTTGDAVCYFAANGQLLTQRYSNWCYLDDYRSGRADSAYYSSSSTVMENIEEGRK